MKKIKKIIKTVVVGILFYTPYSCDYLNVDEYFNDLIALDTIFAKQEYLERYLWGAAAYLPDEGHLYESSYAPYSYAVDEVFVPWRGTEQAGVVFYLDEITPFSAVCDNWQNYYKGIRKTNTILARIDECKDLQAMDRREILSLTRFLRGYLYYHLLMQYGSVPLLPDNVLSVDASVQDLSFPRNTYDECVEYICAEMEYAATMLPDERPSSEKTRPTKYAALSVISRLKLHQASPWFNGNKFYAGWTDKEGKDMISTEYDEKKWAESAFASKRIIDASKFRLHTILREDGVTRDLPSSISALDFPLGAGNIDPIRSYRDMFNGEVFDVRNPELIFQTSLFERNVQLSFPLLLGGYQGLVPTQAIVDAYKRSDGSDVEIIVGDHEEIGETKEFSDIVLFSRVAKRYDNMEARFYASVGFCHSWWQGTSVGSDYEQSNSDQEITYYSDGNSLNSGAPNDVNNTGYSIRKFVHDEDNYYSGSRRNKAFPIFRYAEIILNYVEAINELTTSYSFSDIGQGKTIEKNVDDIVYYFNMIRYRAGLPGITSSDANDVEKMRELIKKERQVEFAFEGGRRYHDVRRWGIMMETDIHPVRGLDVSKKSTEREEFYSIARIKHPVGKKFVSHKHYFWPIKDATLRLNNKLEQNFGW